ncbi:MULTISPECIES: hypothetical protein [unclassified Mesorhizobium]|nr:MULTISPECIES: hypothetical protein [unclassified Mesorhizobium]AZO63026.1 hypothetical protein EJ078_30205 [Mesorhizobium sp. M1A.F.Ca.IN.022.06.1.1]MCT2578592.1 type II toxin-antitoxin system VapB family antitoxin [Mesorhizobium sp. P13.3]MDF3167393.1 hypothetical protein [Mesorhizobium sp. P16.1]MDF3179077.1 hypothetical protein [Mesorhizobium sp. P17.1]MDF3184305.1 hypothetical protein [Mesorhizobium sp. ICCV3110.1]
MAEDAKRGGKTGTLTIRLDPKTRFILEYLSRLKGQSITTVVERAIVAAASQETVADPRYPDQPDSWQQFWDVSDGCRALRMAERPEFFPTYEEDRRLAFAKEHWPFFWASHDRSRFLNYYVDVLWSRIDEFIQIHDDSKQADYFAAGKAMQEALRNAKLAAPEWPIPTKPKPKPSELDDEIPF